VGLAELLAQANAPKGVLYHHFPGGKHELAVAAVQLSAADMNAYLRKTFEPAPSKVRDDGKPADLAIVLVRWFDMSARVLDAEHYERGCPLATVALETTAADFALREALAQAFTGVRATLSQCLVAQQRSPQEAEALATLLVAAYEGALMQARVEQSPKPLRATALALAPLLKAPARRRSA
jgi:TetR/AcrR family transcriptional regulator, lmrAB and yxaGH operons repressor